MNIPSIIKDRLSKSALTKMSLPYTQPENQIVCTYELIQRMQEIIQDAYESGYGQRDAEIMLNSLKNSE